VLPKLKFYYGNAAWIRRFAKAFTEKELLTAFLNWAGLNIFPTPRGQ
jgi:hypothetical protein